MKFEVKVRAGLNIARTSSSVDLTAGLGRDELGCLPPRLTFDADGRSAGEAAAGAPAGAVGGVPYATQLLVGEQVIECLP